MPTWQFYVNGSWRDGEGWALHQHAFGGMGGRPGADGLGAISFPYNVRNVSVEWSETETPVLFLRRELITDSGGAGHWRGGLGEELVMTVLEQRDRHPTWGAKKLRDLLVKRFGDATPSIATCAIASKRA